MRALLAQTRAEVAMTLRRGETLLLTLGIPLLLLVFFSEVTILTTPGVASVDLVTPGILALAIMSTSMVSLGIATGFERGYGVLTRLGVTPLGRTRLLTAKMLSVLLIEVLQAIAIAGVGLALGWQPTGGVSRCPVERAPRGHRADRWLCRLLDRARAVGHRRAAAGHCHLPLPRRLTQNCATPALSRAGVVGPRWTPVTMPRPLTKTVSGKPKKPNLPAVTA